MTFQVHVKCLICRKLTDPTNNSAKENKAAALNLLHYKLCAAMKLEFSPQREWDFAEEPFPYCESCGQRLRRLGELIDQLKCIEEEIDGALATVSALVITTNKNDTNTSDDPALVTPKFDQPNDNFTSLKEKHNYFRSLIIQRFDPRVIVERCDEHHCNYPGLFEDVYEYELVPSNIVIKTEPAIQAFPDTAAEETILNGTEYKVDTSTIDTSSVKLETIIGVEETHPSRTEAPVLSLALNPVENPTTAALNSAKDPDLKKRKPYERLELTFDEASKTYELSGFKFKELENSSYECSTCGHVLTIPKRNNPKQAYIKRHIQTTHMGIPRSDRRRGSWFCDECGKLCTTLQELYSHRLIAHRPFKFQCGHCGAKFPFRGRLKQHVLTHSEQRKKPYSCDECGKSFLHFKTSARASYPDACQKEGTGRR